MSQELEAAQNRLRIVGSLIKSWRKHPHLRLGQFIVNALNLKDPNLYDATDDYLLEKLAEYPQDPPIKPGFLIQE